MYAKLAGDVVLSASYSHELPRYGMPIGLTNYSAAYATGLLLARRVLQKLNLADKYQGKPDVSSLPSLFFEIRLLDFDDLTPFFFFFCLIRSTEKTSMLSLLMMALTHSVLFWMLVYVEQPLVLRFLVP